MLSLAQVVLEGLFRARKGEFRPRQGVTRKRLHGHDLIQGRGLAADHTGGKGGDSRDLSLVAAQADDASDLDLHARLLEGLALRGGLGPLAALHEATRESPLAITRLDIPLDQQDPPVQLEERAGHQLRSQIEHEAATLAHEPLRFAGFEQADPETVATPGTELVFGGPLLYFQGVLRLLEPRPAC